MTPEPHPDSVPWPPGSQWRRAWHTLPMAKRYPVIAGAWAMRIGVPLPMSGKTRQTPQGLVRESRWGKMVHFDEVIQEWQPERYMR